MEFETCDRYEITYESPEYDPSATTFHEQEAGMMGSWGNIKVSGDCHTKRRQVCSLGHKEAEIKVISSTYSDTSAKLLMSFICASVINHDITRVMGQ
jgi:hypothetical protein